VADSEVCLQREQRLVEQVRKIGAASNALRHAAHGGCAVIGGYVVRDRRLRSLYKRYLYSDNCDGTLRSFLPRLRRARGDRPLGLSLSAPTSFGEDNQGRVYVCSLEGPVYRLVPR